MNPDPTSLDRLHDLVAPPPVPWWPPAPGWYWVGAMVLIGASVFALRALLRWQRNRYRREALAELMRQEAALAVPDRRAAAVAALAVLLKRAALSGWPRERVAALHGQDWFTFLDRSAGTARFHTGTGELLEKVAYDPRLASGLEESQLRELTDLVRFWLRHHRVDFEERTPAP